MDAQSVTSDHLRRRSRFGLDSRTAISLGLIVIAALVLMSLIGVITILPAQTITDTLQEQHTERQKLLAASLARQLESFFNTLANDLVDLASRPAVQSMVGQRQEALQLLEATGTRREGQVRAIVRISRDGTPRYAWPDAYQQLILSDSPLPWSVNRAWVDDVLEGRGVQLRRRSTGVGAAYVLAIPIHAGLNITEVLAFEIDMAGYFAALFNALDLGQTGQLWVLDLFGSEIYRFRAQPEFSGGTAQFLNLTVTTLLPGYPTDDRESVVVPVYTAFTQDRSNIGSMVLILSRTNSEANLLVQDTLRALFLFGLGVIAFVLLLGVFIGAFLLRESNRRHQEETRRQTALTLLEISRTLNSSLDLAVVLKQILENLGKLLPHDHASIMLLNDDNETVTIIADMGEVPAGNTPHTLPLEALRGAQEVLRQGTPVVINDTAGDARWTPLPGGRVRSWLGVPLRVREALVGVLNISSYQPGRFSMEDSDVGQAFADQASVAIQSARAHEMQIRAYETELETARAIQNSLLPQEAPPLPQIQMAVRSIPARHVSGDYYQYFMLPDGRFGLAVGDVSGKGIPAALLMAVITSTLRDEIVRLPSPGSLLAELNTRLLPRMQQNKMNSALLVSIFDPATRTMECASGGMLSPYVRNGGWNEIELSGYPLGAAARASYTAKTISLEPEAMVIFLTDGVIEAQNIHRELFGYERFEALLENLPPKASAEEVADTILDAVRRHLDDQEPQDDITVVILKSL